MFPKSHVTEPPKSLDCQLIIVTSIDVVLRSAKFLSCMLHANFRVTNNYLIAHVKVGDPNCRKQNFGKRHACDAELIAIGACELLLLLARTPVIGSIFTY
jgi:hypothetical protein